MATKTSKPETLRSVALDVINNYQRAAKSATASVRSGSSKGIAKVDSTVGELLRYEGKISKKLKSSLETAQGKIVSAADIADEATSKLGKKVKGTLTDTRAKVAKATGKAEDAVDKLFSGVSKKVAEYRPNSRVSKLLENDVIESVKPLGIKGAKLIRYATATLADGAEKISGKIGGSKKAAPVKKAVKTAKAAVKKAPKKAAPAKKAAVTVRRKTPVRTTKAAVTSIAS